MCQIYILLIVAFVIAVLVIKSNSEQSHQEFTKFRNDLKNILESLTTSRTFMDICQTKGNIDEELNVLESNVNKRYQLIWEYGNQAYSKKKDSLYQRAFNELLDSHKSDMRCLIDLSLNLIFKGSVDVANINILKHTTFVSIALYNLNGCTLELCLKQLLVYLLCLKNACSSDKGFDPAINALKEYIKRIRKLDTEFILLKNSTYGVLSIHPDILKFDDTKADEYLCSLINRRTNIYTSPQNYFSCIADNLNYSFYIHALACTWYYARKSPFDNVRFDCAKALFETYTSYDGKLLVVVRGKIVQSYDERTNRIRLGDGSEYFLYDDISQATIRWSVAESSIHFEGLLAEIYSKNEMGGKNAVNLMSDKIDKWLEQNQVAKKYEMLASGLAWMELYEVELRVLRLMVKNNLQMSEEVQERFRFLEAGGTSNVKIYDVAPTENFVFDSSSVEWNTEFNVLFRKLDMKNLKLNYSLAICTLHKTVHLYDDITFTPDEMNTALVDMIDRKIKAFGDKVSYCKKNARAINLENVIYDNAFIFSFNDEKNKCASMLFDVDLFGNSLNLTIITLFTPETGMKSEIMSRYATAIKSNINIEAFRDTLLQSVEDVIKEKDSAFVIPEDESIPDKLFL